MTHTQITEIVNYDKFLEKYEVEKMFTRTILGDILTYRLKNILDVRFTNTDLEKELGIKYDPTQYNPEESFLMIRDHYFNSMKERFGDINVGKLGDIIGKCYSQDAEYLYFHFETLVASEEAYKKIVEFYTN